VIGSFGGGGAQRLAYNLAVGLGRQGFRSFGIAVREEGHYAATPSGGAKIVSLGSDRRRPWTIMRSMFRLRSLISKERIQVLHVHGAPSLPFVVAATRALPAKPRLVFTWQDSESVLETRGWSDQVMIHALRRCDAVSGSSKIVAQKLRERAGLMDVDIFHGGVPVLALKAVSARLTPSIVWLGRIVPSKDAQILVHAAARLFGEGLRFSVDIVGKPTSTTGWYMDETRALIDELGLRDDIKLTGFIPDPELQELLRNADISVQTSHTEGMSIALMEHMMTGLAIVATDVGDTSTAVEDSVSGIIIPPRDLDRLTDALRRLITDAELRQELGRNARRRAQERFSTEAMTRRATECYLTTLDM
jgi:glycosyltransferase involved in cell wall biosynthesis